MFRSIALCIVAIALAGCSTLNMRRGVSAEDLPTIKRVGVWSSLGDTFNGDSIGTTVFNNEHFVATVPEWKVDEFAIAKTVEALQANSRYQVAALDLTGLEPGKMGKGKDSLIWEAARKQGFDKLVLLSPAISENAPSFRPGYGLREIGLFFSTPTRCVYVGYVIGVLDVAKRETIAWEWGGGQIPCKPKSSNDIPFKKQFADYDEGEQKLLRERVEKRLTDTVPYTLGELSLIPEVPLPK